MQQKPNVCQHAKRGICPACADPMRAPRARSTNHLTDFGKALLSALPKKRHKRRRHHHTNTNTQTNG